MQRFNYDTKDTLLLYANILELVSNSLRFEGHRKYLIQHSRMNHHVDGLHYICLQRDKITIKLYYVEDAFKINRNSGYLVHPHNHRYPFYQIVLAGEVRHYRFKTNPFTIGKHIPKYVDGDKWFEYQYCAEEKTVIGWGEPVKVEISSVDRLVAGGRYFLFPHEIHSLQIITNNTVLATHQHPSEEGNTRLFFPFKLEDTDVGKSSEYVPTEKEYLDTLYKIENKIAVSQKAVFDSIGE